MSIPDPIPNPADFRAVLPEMRAAGRHKSDLAAKSTEEYKTVPGPVDEVVRSNLGLPSTGVISTFLTVALRHAVDTFAADLDAQAVATAQSERLFWETDEELRVTAERIRDGVGSGPGSTVA